MATTKSQRKSPATTQFASLRELRGAVLLLDIKKLRAGEPLSRVEIIRTPRRLSELKLGRVFGHRKKITERTDIRKLKVGRVFDPLQYQGKTGQKPSATEISSPVA